VLTQNVELLDNYLRKRAAENIAKGRTEDRVTQDHRRRVADRFTDVQAQPTGTMEPQPVKQQPHSMNFGTKGGRKAPSRGTSGVQEIGVV
jgi:hypothetical protein